MDDSKQPKYCFSEPPQPGETRVVLYLNYWTVFEQMLRAQFPDLVVLRAKVQGRMASAVFPSPEAAYKAGNQPGRGELTNQNGCKWARISRPNPPGSCECPFALLVLPVQKSLVRQMQNAFGATKAFLKMDHINVYCSTPQGAERLKKSAYIPFFGEKLPILFAKDHEENLKRKPDRDLLAICSNPAEPAYLRDPEIEGDAPENLNSQPNDNIATPVLTSLEASKVPGYYYPYLTRDVAPALPPPQFAAEPPTPTRPTAWEGAPAPPPPPPFPMPEVSVQPAELPPDLSAHSDFTATTQTFIDPSPPSPPNPPSAALQSHASSSWATSAPWPTQPTLSPNNPTSALISTLAQSNRPFAKPSEPQAIRSNAPFSQPSSVGSRSVMLTHSATHPIPKPQPSILRKPPQQPKSSTNVPVTPTEATSGGTSAAEHPIVKAAQALKRLAYQHLPSHIEALWEPNLRRWYFVNHLSKTTSWAPSV